MAFRRPHENMRAIELRPLEESVLAQLSEAPERYAAAKGLVLAPHSDLVQEIAQETRQFVRLHGIMLPWGGYLAVDTETRTVVGTCAFKGPPDANGVVEVAYFTFPAHEGCGYATAMLAALRERAAARPEVQVLRAHTLRERNASVRVLEKLGFRWAGEVQDPEDGPVWRWERAALTDVTSAPESA
jgi:[ribosomal protein S5]-alanine N-acetyltransferase